MHHVQQGYDVVSRQATMSILMEIIGLFNDFSKSFKSCNLVVRCCIKNEIQWQGDHNKVTVAKSGLYCEDVRRRAYR